MIVCSCNVISDRDVRACVKPCGASAERARDVFRCLGVSPKCGRCVRNIQALFDRQACLAPAENRAIVKGKGGGISFAAVRTEPSAAAAG